MTDTKVRISFEISAKNKSDIGVVRSFTDWLRNERGDDFKVSTNLDTEEITVTTPEGDTFSFKRGEEFFEKYAKYVNEYCIPQFFSDCYDVSNTSVSMAVEEVEEKKED